MAPGLFPGQRSCSKINANWSNGYSRAGVETGSFRVGRFRPVRAGRHYHRAASGGHTQQGLHSDIFSVSQYPERGNSNDRNKNLNPNEITNPLKIHENVYRQISSIHRVIRSDCIVPVGIRLCSKRGRWPKDKSHTLC